MALGRKGASLSTVRTTAGGCDDGRPASRAWSWSGKPCTFAVEHADAPGTTLVVATNQPHPSNCFGRKAKPELPSSVAQAVHPALRKSATLSGDVRQSKPRRRKRGGEASAMTDSSRIGLGGRSTPGRCSGQLMETNPIFCSRRCEKTNRSTHKMRTETRMELIKKRSP
ncbi:hypothetical protein GCM10023084_73740 [Streptomyces lacrimifluminis]|uniref:Uncharacterized protein n=1 Tax=Streptomyces lacrimifluminis TaxID=1500077 RepID=A0A917P787_9ACTN|nr:hypothetical protein GCM10012282_72340 [Streptomyces lacrimifluminis]